MSIGYKRAGERHIAFRRKHFWGAMVLAATAISAWLGYTGTLLDQVQQVRSQTASLQQDKAALERRVADKDQELDRARGYYDSQVQQTVNAWAAASILLQSAEWHAGRSGTWKRRAELGWREIDDLKERIEKVENSWGQQVDVRQRGE